MFRTWPFVESETNFNSSKFKLASLLGGLNRCETSVKLIWPQGGGIKIFTFAAGHVIQQFVSHAVPFARYEDNAVQ